MPYVYKVAKQYNSQE